MKRVIKANTITSTLPPMIDKFLMDFAQTYGGITYDDISNLGEVWKTTANADDIHGIVLKLRAAMKDFSGDLYEAAQEDADIKRRCDKLVSLVHNASPKSWYFGREEAEQYGDLISEQLKGQKISKRKDLGEQPGGLVYEADRIGIDMWDLLRALEGMCHQGRAQEIDDSTYLVK